MTDERNPPGERDFRDYAARTIASLQTKDAMKPAIAYTIAIVSSAVVGGVVAWVVDRQLEMALVIAPFTALIGTLTIGNALRGSTTHMTDDRAPLSRRGRWILGAIGAVVVVAFAIVMPILAARSYDGPP